MRRLDLHALQIKAFTPRTTDSPHGLRYAPNRLLDQPKPTQANRVWVSDITCLPLATCCCAYLCAFQHVATKHVAGWHVTATIPERLVTTAVQRAFLAQPPTPELVIYSDRGDQCRSNAYRALLHQHLCVRRTVAATATTVPKPKASGPAQNRGTRTARVARFYRPDRYPDQRS